MGSTVAKMNYYALFAEIGQNNIKNFEVCLVGAGLDGVYFHTSELHVLKMNGPDGEGNTASKMSRNK